MDKGHHPFDCPKRPEGDRPMSLPTGRPSALHLASLRVRARIHRAAGFVRRPLICRALDEQNRHSTSSVVAPDGPVVSMTTYDKRLATAYYTLESIAAGKQLPSRLILWVEHQLLAQGLPDTLMRLVRRGLEVRGADEHGPHKKYLPAVLSNPDPDRALVTADDDQLYPAHWLRKLSESSQAMPEVIHCFRGHVVEFRADGTLAPYRSWGGCRSQSPSHLNFATGCGGVIYPIRMQRALARLGTSFVPFCPRADDIWLKAVALRERIMVRQIVPLPSRFYNLRDTRGTSGLAHYNNAGGGNDIQLAATFTPDDLAFLRECAAREATA